MYSNSTYLVGCEEGVICLYDKVTNLFCLWNPIARKINRIMPYVETKPVEDGLYPAMPIILGFGYVTNGMESFLIVIMWPGKLYFYWVKLGVWKSIEVAQELIKPETRTEVMINGRLYWSCWDEERGCDRLYYFDAIAESVHQVQESFLSRDMYVDFIFQACDGVAVAVNSVDTSLFRRAWDIWCCKGDQNWKLIYKTESEFGTSIHIFLASGYSLQRELLNLQLVDITGVKKAPLYFGSNVIRDRVFNFVETLVSC